MSAEDQAEALDKAKTALRVMARLAAQHAANDEVECAAETAVKWIAHLVVVTIADQELLV